MAEGATPCAVPGCGARIRQTARAGVCRYHLHWRPYCGCDYCTGQSGPLRVATAEEIERLNAATVRRGHLALARRGISPWDRAS